MGQRRNLDKIKDLNRRIRAEISRKGRETSTLPDLLAQRGILRSDLGMVHAGLTDCMCALFGITDGELPALLEQYEATVRTEKNTGSAAVNARTAEAVRMYVRDAVLAAPKAQVRDVQALLNSAIAGFDKAEEQLRLRPPRDQKAADTQKAWILAHRGATGTLLIWMNFLKESKDDAVFGDGSKAPTVFSKARADFENAQKISPDRFDWCIQFEAFLLALRGEKQDFFDAKDLLYKLADTNGELPSGIHRSIAMLNSYIAANPAIEVSVRTEAAFDAIESGLLGAASDSEDDKVLYNAASCAWMVSRLLDKQGFTLTKANGPDKEDDARADLAGDLQSYIDSAETRARDQASQSIIVLIGLSWLRALSGPDKDKAAAYKQANAYATLLEEQIIPGLEARAMFRRDPVFATIRDDPALSKVKDAISPNFDMLRNRHNR